MKTHIRVAVVGGGTLYDPAGERMRGQLNAPDKEAVCIEIAIA